MKIKGRRYIAILLVILLIGISIVYWPRKKDINIVDGDVTRKVITYEKTVKDMLIEKGINVIDEDEIELTVKWQGKSEVINLKIQN